MAVIDHSFSGLSTAGFSQRHRLLALHTPLGRDRLIAEQLTATERLSDGGYVLELSALSDDAHIPLRTVMGQAVRVSVQTALAGGPQRIWHGHVTGARFEGANGGFARYALRIEPWLAFLRSRRDSFAFQDKTIFEIVDSVFGDYRDQGKLTPQWRWEIKDREAYGRRSLTVQYRESDFDFVKRLLAEEGLFYWIESRPDGEEGGEHTVVIADSNDAFVAGEQPEIRFHRADATEQADTITRWQSKAAWGVSQVKFATWDYRARQRTTASAQASAPQDPFALRQTDYSGQYMYEDSAQGDRLAHNALAALRVPLHVCHGHSSVRSLAPGQRFQLLDHWLHEGARNTFVPIEITHRARNNFDEDMGQAITQALGPVDDAAVPADFYENAFVALPVEVTYRPATRDGHGTRLHPRPTIIGAQTAIVVGDSGPVLTDRDHRIKVQFHWQRGESSSSRLAHTSGEDNAPASEALGVWVRVAEPVAGGDWGAHMLPRVGQEVLVEFMHGDVDRPIVVGGVYNGSGATDAPLNNVQGGGAKATGNAPAWFAGDAGPHAHNAVLSGFKTQALADSAAGSGGYNQLVFDDTPGEARVTLSTTLAGTRLGLGHLKQQDDNARIKDRGHGGELASEEAVAVRAGAGVLVSADMRSQAEGAVMDSKEAVKQLEDSLAQARELSKGALKQRALIDGDAEELPALAQLASSLETIDVDDPAAGYAQPHMQFSAPGGIGQFTPADAFVVAGESLAQVAPDVNWLAAGHLAAHAAQGVVMFTRGQPADAGRPVTEQGLRLHAASGPVAVRAQQTSMQITAEQAVTAASSQGDVRLTGVQSVLATAGGAYVRLEGGGVQLHAPGKVEFKAGVIGWLGSQAAAASVASSPAELDDCEQTTGNS